MDPAAQTRDAPASVGRAGRRLMLLGAIVVLGSVLRLWHLGTPNIGSGEGFSIAVARLDWSGFLEVVRRFEPNMSLYYTLLHFWLWLGDSESMVRLLSVIPAVATVPVVYALGTHLYGARVGLLGALLLAVNAFHVQYAQEARSYSLLVFLVTLSSYFFIRSMGQPSRRHWTGYVVASALAVYSHIFAALVLLAHLTALPLWGLRRTPWRGLLSSLGLIGILVLPFLYVVLATDVGQIDWVPEPQVYGVFVVLGLLTGRGGPLLLLGYFVVCLIGLLSALRGRSADPSLPRSWPYGVLLAWFGVPLVTSLVISLWKPIFFNRYLLVSLPPLTLLAAVGLSSLRPRWALAGSLVVLLALAMRADATYYRSSGKGAWRAVTARILSRAGPTDAMLVYTPISRHAFDYYAARLGRGGGPRIVFPTGADAFSVRALPSPAFLEGLSSAHDRVWVLLAPGVAREGSGGHFIMEHLSGAFSPAEDERSPGIRVVLYTKQTGARGSAETLWGRR